MRKGQAALEFLMTYGWAIMIVLAAIGALAYFGVLSPSNFLPDQCTATSGVGCLGKPMINRTHVVFTLTNGLGQTVSLESGKTTVSSGTAGADIFFCAKGVTTCNTPPGLNVTDGADVTVKYKFPSAISTTSYKGTFQFNYTNSNSGLPESVVVQIAGKVK